MSRVKVKATGTGFERYSNTLLAKVKEILDRENLAENADFREVIVNILVGADGPKQLNRKRSRQDEFFAKIGAGFFEIALSYHCLEDVEVYIGRFPYPKTRISRCRYLLYTLENYLHEIYILRERLTTYATTVERLHRKDENSQDVRKRMRQVRSTVRTCLAHIIDTRGGHVHRARLRDTDLEGLGLMEIIAGAGDADLQFLDGFFPLRYREIRKKHKKTIKSNNLQIRELLDVYFDSLYEIVFEETGRINLPKGYRSRNWRNATTAGSVDPNAACFTLRWEWPREPGRRH